MIIPQEAKPLFLLGIGNIMKKQL